MVKVISSTEAAKLIKDGDVLATSGFASLGVPEALLKSLEKRFIEEQNPRNLTLMFAAAQGDGESKGLNHLAHEGLIKKVIGGHFNLAPMIGQLIRNNKIYAYNLPQGIMCNIFRDIASKKTATISKVGLNTFVDPRIEGGKANSITKDEIVEVIEILGQENLLYKCPSIDVAFIRGTYADEKGNITMEHEATYSEATCIAQAVRNCGGIVIVQVEKVVKSETLDPRSIKIPRIYVDYIVESKDKEDQEQVLGYNYDPSLAGDIKITVNNLEPLKLDSRKIIGRRAAMELIKGTVVNIGIGVPEAVSNVANEEGIGEFITLTVEPGPIGGIPQGGKKFGASINPECIFDQPTQFDFYDGGGLDIAFLGLAQVDKHGNINVSKFGTRIAGCGGFINITQNSKKVVFCGTLTAKGLEVKVDNGELKIINEGREKKFVNSVEQITFSGKYAMKVKQTVIYITERAVFELKDSGVHLIEIAPGIDIQKDLLDLLDFKPIIDENLKLMDRRIFMDELMGLKG
ncbi:MULTISPECIES: acyl CoA--acetate/3-ketoacid CoA transferase [unclassified Clostridium]|uniref:acyl CoA:acetate/3-ketoacid CoA transferase n=1 Tax=unclassified Clostridium TaxID=2614128 RepID=UPI000297DAAC|nr:MULTISPECIES: acyl CoA--acetate/3-ketoacid CoA transferase [unclassified Clostridium]EKQ57480.1 MAG: acyl CoA:acetate/3-ketoacid CoA transferase [Clostridium sp. Maddingley MBC34-26]